MRALIQQIARLFTPAPAGADDLVALAPAASLRTIARWFWPDVRPYRWQLALLVVFIALGPAVETATIWLYKRLVDEVLVPRALAPFFGLAALYVGLTLLGGLVAFGNSYVSAWVGERFLLDLRTRVFTHLQNMSPSYFQGQRLGDLVARLTGDIADVEGLLVADFDLALSYLIRIALFAGALFLLEWRLAALALVVSPLFWLAAQRFSTRIQAVSRDRQRRIGGIGAVAEESLANAALVQAYNRQATEIERFRAQAREQMTAQLALTRLAGLFAPIVSLVQLGGVLIVVGAGVWELTHGNLTLGGLLAFLAFLSQLFGPVNGLTTLATTAAASAAGAERIIEVLDETPAVPQSAGAAAPAALGAIVFDRVSFHYPDADEAALSDVSFRVAPGETLALVGPSGAGKSTVVNLLLRFYDPAAGRIALDGHDLRDLTLDGLRDNIAVVFQDSLIFAGSIRDNIAYGRAGASELDIVRAAKAADAHAFITALPDGYDTIIGQRGARLSGGQRQRIAIARALLRDAPILILDEPTSGLDAAASQRLADVWRRAMAGRTTIVVSHNLLTVREATSIAVLNGGRIAEQGSHAELLARDGAYARLYRLHHPDFAQSSLTSRPSPAAAGEGSTIRLPSPIAMGEGRGVRELQSAKR
ncbi:MAG TPA: ABC transporter ATP-binding protein [Thermomicrobiales bacterium]|nr:ABC transporter ATP-binding protein [Thermomicrobiales bacterium]